MVISGIKIPGRKPRNFCRRHKVQRLALFGSVPRSDFRSDSDVDVFLRFEPTARIGFIALGRMRRELSEVFQRPVDLVLQEGLKPAIRDSVLGSAREIHAA